MIKLKNMIRRVKRRLKKEGITNISHEQLVKSIDKAQKEIFERCNDTKDLYYIDHFQSLK